MDCDIIFVVEVKFCFVVVVGFFVLFWCYEMCFLDNVIFFWMIMNGMNLIFIVMENEFMG